MITIPTKEPLFTVLLMFECQPDEQSPLIDKLFNFINTRMKPQPGFVSSLVYASEDGTKVVEHFQWKDRASYENYRQSDSGKKAAQWLVTLHPQVFYLELAHSAAHS